MDNIFRGNIKQFQSPCIIGIMCYCVAIIADRKDIFDDIGANKTGCPENEDGTRESFYFFLKRFVIDHESLKVSVYYP